MLLEKQKEMNKSIDMSAVKFNISESPINSRNRHFNNPRHQHHKSSTSSILPTYGLLDKVRSPLKPHFETVAEMSRKETMQLLRVSQERQKREGSLEERFYR